jgi:hypothetical protein
LFGLAKAARLRQGEATKFNYAVNGRQESLVLGRYGPGGLKLSEAREKLLEAKKSLAAGKSPARQKGAAAARRRAEHTFAQWAEEWLASGGA